MNINFNEKPLLKDVELEVGDILVASKNGEDQVPFLITNMITKTGKDSYGNSGKYTAINLKYNCVVFNRYYSMKELKQCFFNRYENCIVVKKDQVTLGIDLSKAIHN